jgi:hypothetical protein
MTTPRVSTPALWLLLSIVSAGCMSYYVAEIWSANQPPRFNDLYASWWGAHELLLHGRNPYSPAVAHEIQNVIYGEVTPSSPQDPAGIGGGFAYPPYTVLLLWPTVYLSFSAAQKIFLGVSVLATLLSLAIWLRLMGFRWSPQSWLAVSVFVLGSFPTLQALKLRNPSLLAAAFIAIAIFLLSTDHLILAGVWLGLSTFKPQFTILLVPGLILWSLSDWRRRRPMVWSFLTTFLLLVSVSEWLVPGWITCFLRVIRAYRSYTYGHSLLDVWLTPTWGLLVAAGLAVLAFVLCWPHRCEPANSPRFLACTGLLLATTLVVIPTLAPHAQLLLLPGVLCLLRSRSNLRSFRLGRLTIAATWGLLAWPWIASFGMLLAGIWLPAPILRRFWQVPLFTSPVLPFAVMFALAGFVKPASGAGDQTSPLPAGAP